MRVRNPLFVAVKLCVAMVAIGCSGGNGNHLSPPLAMPVFTSSPETAAAEGTAYTYTIAATDPAGGSVSFTLASGPAGAVITGNTLTWTPTPEESRVENSFRITATTSEGGSGTQAFSVTPTGTVHIDRVVTKWTAAGSTDVPFDWMASPDEAAQVAIFVPRTDGTFLTLSGTGSADGSFTIPSVPGGFYWLQMSARYTYWTSASHFDYGTEEIGQGFASTGSLNLAQEFEFQVDGMDPWQSTDSVQINLDNGFGIGANGILPDGATSGDLTADFRTTGDFSNAKSGLLYQVEPLSIGSMQAIAVGPSLALSNLSLTYGGLNTFVGTLGTTARSSTSFAVKGSDWASLYNNSGPVMPTPYDTAFGLVAQPYFAEGIADGSDAIPFHTMSSFSRLVATYYAPDTPCDTAPTLPDYHSQPPKMNQAPVVADQDFGSFQFGDPFPTQGLRYFTYCQEAVVSVPDAGSDSPVVVVLGDGLATGLPIEPIAPLVATVENPKINGESLFTAQTVNSRSVNLSWSAPTERTAPTAYRVEVFAKTPVEIPPLPPPYPPAPPTMGTAYLTIGRLFTTKTNVTLPYSLVAGESFLVVVTALVDGRANVETSPLRAGLPQANASVVSAVMTMGGGTPAVAQSRTKPAKGPFVAIRKNGSSQTIIFPTRQ